MEGDFTHIVNQLILDNAFVKQVLDGEINKEHWLREYDSIGVNRVALDKAVLTIVALNKASKEEFSEDRINQLWSRIEAGTTKEQGVNLFSISRNKWWKPFSVAASVALLVGMLWMLKSSPSMTEINTGIADRITVNLLDGSIVKVSSETKLSWSEENYSRDRKINLDGEAFFEVEKGETFTVESDLGVVEVLGTSFNVYSRHDVFRVSCRTGKVRVNLKNGYSVVLTPGKQFESTNGQHIASDIKQEELWIYGRKYMKNIHIDDFVVEVERQFDVKLLMTDGIRNKRGNFVINLGELDSTLHHISWLLNGVFVEKEKNVYQFEKN